MSLSDEIRAYVHKPAPKCTTCAAVDSLDPELRDELTDVLASGDLPKTAVARWLAVKTGMKITEGMLAHHCRQGH